MKLKIFWFVLIIIVASATVFAHEGDTHGEVQKTIKGATYFSSEALSDKYEVLIKYGELVAGNKEAVTIFLSDARTNKPIDSAAITAQIPALKQSGFSVQRMEAGVYRLMNVVFPANQPYDLQLSINSPLGPDLVQVSKIEVGKKLTVADASDGATTPAWLWAAGGLVLGGLLMFLLMRSRNKKSALATIVLMLLIPTAAINPTQAHGGDEHGAPGGGGGGLSTSFTVEKESQFLFNIRTQPVGTGTGFYSADELLGTVTPAPQGLAVIQSPQTGTLISIKVTPGQTVRRGQVLATVQQQIEAGAQLDIIAQRNSLNAEVKAAKAQYDRLKSIEDIAAKKDVTEARARYEAAVQNLRAFQSGVSGGPKLISLTAPISGVVGNFNYAVGAVVGGGQTLFEITDLSKLYVEVQSFGGSEAGNRFVAYAVNDTTAHPLQLVSAAQTVETGNQAQRLLFSVNNAQNRFRIGENVRVLRYGNSRITGVVVPTTAVVDVDGKPAVFIKDRAEQWSISFIQKGESNAVTTAISKGVETGERIATDNVAQMKMIYLAQ